MKRYKSISTTALGSLVLTLVLACVGSSTPAAMNDIPVYPGATSIDAADNPIASALLESMEQEADVESTVDAEFDFYALPAGTTLNDVKDFYAGEMEGTDWKPSDDLAIDDDGFHMFGWARPQQAVGIGFVTEEVSGTPLMLILLATEK
jgi:hypothetical protein